MSSSAYAGSNETREQVLSTVRSFIDATSTKPRGTTPAKDFILAEGFDAISHSGQFHVGTLAQTLERAPQTLGQMPAFAFELRDPEPEVWIYDDKVACVAAGLVQEQSSGEGAFSRTFTVFVLLNVSGQWKITGVCGSVVPPSGPLEPPIATSAADEVLNPVYASLENLRLRKFDDSKPLIMPGARGTFTMQPAEPSHETIESHTEGLKAMLGAMPEGMVYEEKHSDTVVRVCEAGSGAAGGGKLAMLWTRFSGTVGGNVVATGLEFFGLYKGDGDDTWRLGAVAALGDDLKKA
jgi:hypothetical protein